MKNSGVDLPAGKKVLLDGSAAARRSYEREAIGARARKRACGLHYCVDRTFAGQPGHTGKESER